MATRCLGMPPLSNYLKKRNWIIFCVVFGLLVLLSISFYAYFVESTYQDVLQSIAFIFGVVFLIGLLIAKQMMFTISMYTHYYRMIDEDLPPFDVTTHPYLLSFNKELTKQDFIMGVDRALFQIYYRVFSRLPYVKRTGLSIMWLVITKTDIDTYDSRIEDDIVFIKSKISESAKIQNEITLVFHQIETLTPAKKEETQKIVNFHLQNRAMISIPCAVITSKKQVYALRPKKQFPNKYYYVAIQFLKEITSAKINPNES
jgi:hypothetical protein